MGSSTQFSGFVKKLAARPHNPYGPLRELVRPYILRRLKTDKSIIGDLPDKTEVKTFCPLSRKQAALYQQAVDELSRQLEQVEGIKRRGLLLAFPIRLKQICNQNLQTRAIACWFELPYADLSKPAEARVAASRMIDTARFPGPAWPRTACQ